MNAEQYKSILEEAWNKFKLEPLDQDALDSICGFLSRKFGFYVEMTTTDVDIDHGIVRGESTEHSPYYEDRGETDHMEFVLNTQELKQL